MTSQNAVADDSLPPILPAGTKVVARIAVRSVGALAEHPAGSVGVIVEAPVDAWHSYRVRFNDGQEVSLKRDALVVLKQYQRQGVDLEGPTDAYDFSPHVIYKCVVGSRAYGLEGEGSDTDYRGVYLPPAELHWSLFGVPEQLENDERQECFWELQKFLIMALKANPNVLECLHTPLVEFAAPLALELLDMRQAFMSKLVYQTYNGYVMSQFKKLSGDLRNKGEVKWKHVMHLVRLLNSGIAALRTGVVPVRVDDALRERLLAIKRGERPWEEVDSWRLKLHEQFDAAFASTPLPDRPDYARVNDFLIRARRSMT